MLHLAALAAAIAALSSWPLLFVLSAIVASAFVAIGASLQRLPGAICGLELAAEGQCARWRDRKGNWHPATLATEGYVCAWLVVLALDPQGGCRFERRLWLVLGPDSGDEQVLRSLRLRLRQARQPTPQGKNHAAL